MLCCSLYRFVRSLPLSYSIDLMGSIGIDRTGSFEPSVKEHGHAEKKFSAEQILTLLRQIEVLMA